MSGAARRFRVMGLVVSVALFVLLFGMLLRYGFGEEAFSKAWSPIHGALYIVYLVVVADVARRARWSLLRTVGVAVAGAVPVVSYVVERRVSASLASRSAAA